MVRDAEEQIGAEYHFEGSAGVAMLSDGVTIGWLSNGSWTGLGSFETGRD